MSDDGRSLDDEIYVVADDLSWLSDRRAIRTDGIYRVSYRELFDVFRRITGKDEQEFWLQLDVGLDDRWFRLSNEFHDACLRWIQSGRRISEDFIEVQ